LLSTIYEGRPYACRFCKEPTTIGKPYCNNFCKLGHVLEKKSPPISTKKTKTSKTSKATKKTKTTKPS
jgi:hypothetical protein